MMKKKPPVEISKVEMEYLTTLKERDRRHFIACKASGPEGSSVRAVCAFFGCSPNTVSRASFELLNHIAPPDGRQRMPGGGAKRKTDKHPEWVAAFKDIVSRHMAGLPQDEGVVWLDIGVRQIRRELLDRGFAVSGYIVRQMLKSEGLKKRSFTKSLTLREVKDRDAQFVKIDAAKTACIEAGIPIVSVDTKKKELIGNFKRDGQVYCSAAPHANDHDFETFAEGRIVPQGIYDIARNTGYLSIGTSHDTSEFVCDNIERVWNSHMRRLYPDAGMLVVLCDGGGSNSSRHHIVKQDFMDLADRIGMKILVMHYPPYCSKFNPIEHRLFSQITRSWSGTPLFSVADACRRAASTVTRKGLKVLAEIVDKVYETQRKVHESFQDRLARQVVFDDSLNNWNYLISPSVSSHVIF